jgi:DNA-binding NtrC family response regulator
MKAIFIQRQNNIERYPVIFDFDTILNDDKGYLTQKEKLSKLYNMVNRVGFITLLSQADSEQFLDNLRNKFHYRKMQKKSQKMELYRALKLDKPALLEVPKIMEVNYSDTGSFKRSFTPFFHIRYQEGMAPIVLVIPDQIHKEMMMEKNWKDYSNAPINSAANLDPYLQRWIETTLLQKELEIINNEFIGESLPAILVRTLIFKASITSTNVMLIGETGVGKSLIAKLIHSHSTRKDKPFVSVNCAAIPDQDFAVLLYGKKCVNGRMDRPDSKGLLQRAEGGTLFLDEISELSFRNQTELMNSLERGIFSPAITDESPKFDVRIIASTNSNLPLRVRLKSFRENLFYQLSGIQIIIPPLRERPEDIPAIANSIWKRIAPLRKPLNHSFLTFLKNRPWPGNMREMQMTLENVVNIFTDQEPSKEGLEYLQRLRNDQGLFQRGEVNDYYKTLQYEYKNRLFQSSRIIRGIRVKLRPLINNDQEVIRNFREVHKISVFVHKQTDLLGEFLLDPLYFKDPGLYNQIRCFRYDLDEVFKKLPAIPETFPIIWQTQFQDKYEDILHRIFKLVWSEEQGEE